jgi:uncharacterized membrane protein YgcG
VLEIVPRRPDRTHCNHALRLRVVRREGQGQGEGESRSGSGRESGGGREGSGK